jgi:hypothetical protein
MKKVTYSSLAAGFLIIIAAAFILGRGEEEKLWTSAPELTETYINTRFGYEFRYPKGAEPGYTGLATTSSIQQSVEIVIGSPSIFRVNALDADTHDPQRSSLLQRVEAIRQTQLSSGNSNISNRRVGVLEETEFAGQRAYSFALTDAYSTSNGGYLLEPAGTVYQLIFVANSSGILLMIQYPAGNDEAALIARSFRLTRSP